MIRDRYCVVAIKVCRDGNFVTTAYTGSAIKEGPHFVIPAGHDAYVPGDQACEMVLFEAPQGVRREQAA